MASFFMQYKLTPVFETAFICRPDLLQFPRMNMAGLLKAD